MSGVGGISHNLSCTPQGPGGVQVLERRQIAANHHSRQFIVEVDDSDSGVGAVLFQPSAPDQKLHPCAFFSRRLSPAEHNYDVGNRELLAVKLALEEWKHWLEGAVQ